MDKRAGLVINGVIQGGQRNRPSGRFLFSRIREVSWQDIDFQVFGDFLIEIDNF